MERVCVGGGLVGEVCVAAVRSDQKLFYQKEPEVAGRIW